MNYIKVFAAYFFGVVLTLIGLVSFAISAISAFAWLLMDALLLPPIRDRVYALTKRSLSEQQRAYALLGLFVLALGVMIFTPVNRVAPKPSTQLLVDARRAKMDEERVELVKKLSENRSEVLAELEDKIKSGQYSAAVELALYYYPTKDPEILKMHKQAKDGLARSEGKLALAKIEAELKLVSASDYLRNEQLYAQLLVLQPENDSYRKKHELYWAKVEHYLLSSTRSGDIVSALHKRVGAQYTGFTRTETNCRTMLMKEIGYSEESPEAIKSNPTKWFELVPGSSKSDLADFVCTKHRNG